MEFGGKRENFQYSTAFFKRLCMYLIHRSIRDRVQICNLSGYFSRDYFFEKGRKQSQE